MILIAKNSDYWDWAANVYRDEAIRFERKADEQKIVPHSHRATAGLRECVSFGHYQPWHNCKWPEHKLAYSVISIAGLTPIPVVELSIFEKASPSFHQMFALPNQASELVATLEHYHLDVQAPGSHFSWLNDKKSARLKALHRWVKTVNTLDFSALHQHVGAPIMRVDQIHRYTPAEHKTPFVGALRCSLNPLLSEYHIQQYYDDITVYQALCQWLAAKQHPEAPPTAIEDKYKIEQKGFDPKYGFRKPPLS